MYEGLQELKIWNIVKDIVKVNYSNLTIQENMKSIDIPYNHTRIYYSFIDLLDLNDIQYASKIMSFERKEKLARFRYENDKKRMLACELLFNIGLKELYGINAFNEEIRNKLKRKVSAYGKPFLYNYNIFFNMSHSGNLAVCSFSNDEVGVDIQMIEDFDYMSLESIIHPTEYNYILSKNTEGQNTFFEYWVMLESYFKAMGTGLNKNIKKIHFSRNEESIHVFSDKLCQPYIIKLINDIKGYKMAVCMKE